MEQNDDILNGKFIIALSRSMRALHRKSETMFYQSGLTMSQFAVLEALCNKGDMTLKELINAVLSTSGNMTVVVRNLEERALVCRAPNPADGRSFLISVTQVGAELLNAVYARHMALVAEAADPLTSEEKQQIITILKKLK